MNVSCKICNILFTTTKSTKVCSDKCRKVQTDIRNNRKNKGKKKGIKLSTPINCKECKNLFTRTSASIKCCSEECNKLHIANVNRKKAQRYRDDNKDTKEYKARKKMSDIKYRNKYTKEFFYIKNKIYRDNNKEALSNKKRDYYLGIPVKVKKQKGKEQREKHKNRIKLWVNNNRESLNNKKYKRNIISKNKAYSHRERWYNEGEMILIRLYYGNESYKTIGEALGRTLYAIASRLDYLMENRIIKIRKAI